MHLVIVFTWFIALLVQHAHTLKPQAIRLRTLHTRAIRPTTAEQPMQVSVFYRTGPGGRLQMIDPTRLANTWVANYEVGYVPTIEQLYTEANKGFNWVKKQNSCLTAANNLLVAAYYDETTRNIYLSTIPRGKYLTRMTLEGRSLAVVWATHRNAAARMDAEDGAYFHREFVHPLVPSFERDLVAKGSRLRYGTLRPEGSKIAVWGQWGSNSEAIKTAEGSPQNQCDSDCRNTANSLGVYRKFPV